MQFYIGYSLALTQDPMQQPLQKSEPSSVTLASPQAAEAIKKFTVNVQVQSMSSAELTAALKVALKQVLLNQTGNTLIYQYDNIQRAFSRPSSYVKLFDYQAVSKNISPTGLILKVYFDAKLIEELIKNAKIPSKSLSTLPLSTNSELLAIIALNPQIQGNENPEPFITNQSSSLAYEFFNQQVQLERLPIIYPLFDLQDMETLNLQDGTNKNFRNFVVFAKRYHVSYILWGEVTSLNPSTWQSTWRLLTAQGTLVQTWNEEGASLQEVFEKSLANPRLAFYKIKNSVIAPQAQRAVQLNVQGIKRYQDYTEAMSFLRHLSKINNVNVIQANGDVLVVSLTTSLTDRELLNILTSQNKMAIVSQFSGEKVILKWQS